ncbi:MAG: hypothetical protein KC731_37190 [Myxococcales bacterium]|nr:hypothetical protein [Myxococcales bacterium]
MKQTLIANPPRSLADLEAVLGSAQHVNTATSTDDRIAYWFFDHDRCKVFTKVAWSGSSETSPVSTTYFVKGRKIEHTLEAPSRNAPRPSSPAHWRKHRECTPDRSRPE